MTASGNYELQVDMWDYYDKYAVARYSTFKIEDASKEYALVAEDYYEVAGERPAGDSLGWFSGQKFSHEDRAFVNETCFDKHGDGPGWFVLGL